MVFGLAQLKIKEFVNPVIEKEEKFENIVQLDTV